MLEHIESPQGFKADFKNTERIALARLPESKKELRSFSLDVLLVVSPLCERAGPGCRPFEQANS